MTDTKVREGSTGTITDARRILLAVSGPESHAAAGVVAELGAALGQAEVEVLHVQEVEYEQRPGATGDDPARAAARFAQTFATELNERGVTARAEVRPSTCECVADDILAEARERHADLIVVGCRARSGLASWLFGSTAHHVIRRTDRPVLVVRDAAPQAAAARGAVPEPVRAASGGRLTA